MRRLLKIFQGKIHASKLPSCWPRIAPRGPITLNGFPEMASRATEGEWEDGIGNSVIAGSSTARDWAKSVPAAARTNRSLQRVAFLIFKVRAAFVPSLDRFRASSRFYSRSRFCRLALSFDQGDETIDPFGGEAFLQTTGPANMDMGHG
jgi:hypothetical protein